MTNAVTNEAAVRNGKPDISQVEFSLKNKTTTTDSTTRTTYRQSKLFPSVLCQTNLNVSPKICCNEGKILYKKLYHTELKMEI
jgi:hypothetical protein